MKTFPKKTFQFWWRLFSFGDHLILTEKSLQSDSRLMKIWLKFVYCCFQLPKKPPLTNSWLRACTWSSISGLKNDLLFQLIILTGTYPQTHRNWHCLLLVPEIVCRLRKLHDHSPSSALSAFVCIVSCTSISSKISRENFSCFCHQCK